MSWPQYTLAGSILIGMGISVARFGQPKTDKYDLIDLVVGPAVVVWLLYMGGFWDPLLR